LALDEGLPSYGNDTHAAGVHDFHPTVSAKASIDYQRASIRPGCFDMGRPAIFAKARSPKPRPFKGRNTTGWVRMDHCASSRVNVNLRAVGLPRRLHS
jgi:hypothetical protein